MKYNCPYCDANLKWKLQKSKPLPGERKILPMHVYAVCSVCDGRLVQNTHWSETVAMFIPVFPIGLIFVFQPSLKQPLVLWVAGFLLLICAGVFAYFQWRYWRNFQRYKRFEN